MKYNPKKHRLPPFNQNGLLVVDKPAEWTSFDVVNFVRSRFNIPKVGHCGTLDPAATGVMVLLFGTFTRLNEKFSSEDKVYDATLRIGMETDSQDMDGEITAERDWSSVTPEMLQETIKAFVGPQQQIPPMVSAVKKDGKRLYELARKGIEVEREPRDIVIHSLEISRIELPFADLRIHCSKGTYVRTLCADIGTRLGCGGVLHCLRRVRSGEFDISEAVTVDQIKQWEQPELLVWVRNYLHNRLANMKEFQG